MLIHCRGRELETTIFQIGYIGLIPILCQGADGGAATYQRLKSVCYNFVSPILDNAVISCECEGEDRM